jgi:site-specific recombinase XerD
LNAIDRAFPPSADLAPKVTDDKKESRREWWWRLTDAERDRVKAWRREHRWFPYQLRHSFATRVRKQFDLEVAQVLLGQERCDVTQVYTAKNTELAATIAAQIG